MHVPFRDRVLKSIAATVTTIVFGLLIFLSFTSGGQTAPIQEWTPLEETAYPFAVASAESLLHDGRIYVFGGKDATGESRREVYFTEINEDGTLAGWEPTEPLLAPVYLHSVAATDEFVYVIGGLNIGGPEVYSAIWRAAWREDGGVVGWTKISDYPMPIQLHESTIVGNRLYVMGGYSASLDPEEERADIYYATISSTGSLGTWEPVRSLPTSLRRFSIATIDNTIYVVGGDIDDQTQNLIRKTTVQSTGQLSPWTTPATLPAGSEYQQSVIHENALVVLGGSNRTNTAFNTVYAYPINADKTLGDREVKPALPNPLFRHTALVVPRVADDYIYIIGGYTSITADADNAAIDTVYRSAPPAPPTPTPTATPQPGVQLNMDNDPNRWLAPNDSVTYVIEYFNPGVEAVQNVRIDDTIPPEVELVPDSVSDAGANEPDINDALGLIQWSIGDLEAGERGQVSYQAKRRSSVNSADGVLSISKDGPAQVAAGEDILYTLTVTNNLTGDGLPIQNIVITDTIPLYATDVRGPDRIENGVAQWEIEELANSSSIAVQMVVRSNRTLVNSDYGAAAIGTPFRAPGTNVIVTQVDDTGPGPGDGIVIPNNAQAVWTFQGEEKRTFSNWVRNPSSNANYNIYMPVIQR